MNNNRTTNPIAPMPPTTNAIPVPSKDPALRNATLEICDSHMAMVTLVSILMVKRNVQFNKFHNILSHEILGSNYLFSWAKRKLLSVKLVGMIKYVPLHTTTYLSEMMLKQKIHKCALRNLHSSLVFHFTLYHSYNVID